MNFIDILRLEDNNRNRIFLHHEGMFLRAYNQSAFLCWDRISRFKLKRRLVKNVNAWVISLGFPFNTKDKWLRDRKVTRLNEKLYVVEVEAYERNPYKVKAVKAAYGDMF